MQPQSNPTTRHPGEGAASTPRLPRPSRSPGGFTLLEPLVTVALFSVGLMGVAALHAEGSRTTEAAMLRSRAVIFVDDISDRMRANRSAAHAGDYVVAVTDSGAHRDCTDGPGAQSAVACSPREMAEHDIWLWKSAIGDPRTGLPLGTATITLEDEPLPTFTITVSWTEAAQVNSHSRVIHP